MKGSFAETITSQTMNLDLSKTMGGTRTVTGLCTDLYLIVIRMREAEGLGDPASLRKLITYYFGLFEKNCAAIGLPADSIESAKYALVALIDETVLSVPGACRDFWLDHPLQLDFFGTNMAGEEFFTRLDKLIAAFDSKKDVLEVCYICLSLGYEGKFKISNPQARLDIMDNLGTRLRKGKIRISSGISPHPYYEPEQGFLKKSAGSRGHRPIPLWIAAVICLGAVGLWYGVQQFLASDQASLCIQSIQPNTTR